MLKSCKEQNSIIMSFSNTSQSSTDRLISETNNKLKEGFKSLCCQLSNATEAGASYQFVPVYEYKELYSSSFASNGPIINFTILEDEITFTLSDSVYNICDEFAIENDSIIGFVYEDSVGREYKDAIGAYTTSFADFQPNKMYTIRITLIRSSGYQIVYEINVETDGSNNITTASTRNTYSNTNISNVNTSTIGRIPTSYEVMVADILEVRVNGEFVKYVDMEGADYVPTYCLSYNPVMPFTDMNLPKLKVEYNSVDHIYLEAAAMVTPIIGNTVHSISYFVTNGTAEITIGTTSSTIPANVYATITASTLIAEDFSVDATSGKVYITITRP